MFTEIQKLIISRFGRKALLSYLQDFKFWIHFSILLRTKGIDTDSLPEFAFLDKHSTVAYSIMAKQFDAGATYDGILKEEV